jgi:hypothetical protein
MHGYPNKCADYVNVTLNVYFPGWLRGVYPSL